MPGHKAFFLKWACNNWPYKEPLGMWTLLNVLERNGKMIFDAVLEVICTQTQYLTFKNLSEKPSPLALTINVIKCLGH